MANRKNRIFIAISLFIAFSDFLFVYINYRSSEATLQENIENVGRQIQSAFELATAATEIRMVQLATFVANDPKVQKAFLDGKKAVDAEGGGPGREKATLARMGISPCPAKCECAYVREIIQLVSTWPKTSIV